MTARLLLVAVLLLPACATTELDQIWQAADAPRMDSVLIIADSPGWTGLLESVHGARVSPRPMQAYSATGLDRHGEPVEDPHEPEDECASDTGHRYHQRGAGVRNEDRRQ